jgi:hypothetical protein
VAAGVLADFEGFIKEGISKNTKKPERRAM